MQFKTKKPHYEYLRKKWIARDRGIQDKFWEKHGSSLKQVAIGSLGGLLLLSVPSVKSLQAASDLTLSKVDVLNTYDRNVLLAQALSYKMPKEVRPLEPAEEKAILDILSRNFNFEIKAEINGIRLSRNYGLIGGEQHLYRYPGDNLYAHAATTTDWANFGEAGIAPTLGAWGYFAQSKESFSEVDKQRERYYLAAQTFLIPGYAENFEKYRDFFKFRKMLVVNPKTGQAVVGDIGDVGPSDWTGKHLGGSPEVMDVLGFGAGPRKGPVLYFFIDDPDNSVPLGPVKVKNET